MVTMDSPFRLKLNRGLKAADLAIKPLDLKPVMSQP